MTSETAESTSPPQKGLATVSEVAQYLNISRSKAYGLMDAGELAYVKLGKNRRVPWDAVMRLVQDNLVTRRA